MTLAIAIGNDTNEINYIKRTIDVLKTAKTYYTNSDLEELDTIIDWYNGIYSILTDADLFAVQP